MKLDKLAKKHANSSILYNPRTPEDEIVFVKEHFKAGYRARDEEVKKLVTALKEVSECPHYAGCEAMRSATTSKVNYAACDCHVSVATKVLAAHNKAKEE